MISFNRRIFHRPSASSRLRRVSSWDQLVLILTPMSTPLIPEAFRWDRFLLLSSTPSAPISPHSLLEPVLLINLSHLPSPPYYATASGTCLVGQIHCMPTSRLRRCRLGPGCYMPVLLTVEIWMKFTT